MNETEKLPRWIPITTVLAVVALVAIGLFFRSKATDSTDDLFREAPAASSAAAPRNITLPNPSEPEGAFGLPRNPPPPPPEPTTPTPFPAEELRYFEPPPPPPPPPSRPAPTHVDRLAELESGERLILSDALPADRKPGDSSSKPRGEAIKLPAGLVINARLDVSFDSDRPGPVSATSLYDVRNPATGEILLPVGTQFFGTSRQAQRFQRAAIIDWTSVQLPDGPRIPLESENAFLADRSDGALGETAARTDRHIAGAFAGAVLTAISAAALQLAEPPRTTGNGGFVDPRGEAVASGTEPLVDLMTDTARSLAERPPTIRLSAGTWIQIRST